MGKWGSRDVENEVCSDLRGGKTGFERTGFEVDNEKEEFSYLKAEQKGYWNLMDFCNPCCQ